MSPGDVLDPADGNRLLAALPRDEYERLRSDLESVELEVSAMLYRTDETISHVYFIDEGVSSMVQLTAGADPVEVGTVGKEGMVGIPVFLGAQSTQGTAFHQVPGRARRMSADRFREVVLPGSPLHDLLHRYLQAMMVMIAQSSACNRRHPIEQRCARWLCMTRDRVSTDQFLLTQEFLGQMLGVRRASVSAVAGQLQADGLIRYNRGQMLVVDRGGLEERTCECYRIIRTEFERMLAPN